MDKYIQRMRTRVISLVNPARRYAYLFVTIIWTNNPQRDICPHYSTSGHQHTNTTTKATYITFCLLCAERCVITRLNHPWERYILPYYISITTTTLNAIVFYFSLSPGKASRRQHYPEENVTPGKAIWVPNRSKNRTWLKINKFYWLIVDTINIQERIQQLKIHYQTLHKPHPNPFQDSQPFSGLQTFTTESPFDQCLHPMASE